MPDPVEMYLQRMSKLESDAAINIDPEDLRPALEEGVFVERPDIDTNFKRITGADIMDTTRKTRLSVTLELETILQSAGGELASASLGGWGTGWTLLMIASSLSKETQDQLRPDEALTYGVAWEQSKNGTLPVIQSELVNAVCSRSRSVEEIPDMDEATVHACLDELESISCLEREYDQGLNSTLIWLCEKFSVEYTF